MLVYVCWFRIDDIIWQTPSPLVFTLYFCTARTKVCAREILVALVNEARWRMTTEIATILGNNFCSQRMTMFFCRKHTANIISSWFWIAEISSLQKFFFFWYSLLSILESFKNAIVVQLISRLIIWLSRWENQKEAVYPTNLEATRKRLGVRNFHQPCISLFDVLKSQNFFWTLRWRVVISE